jgi:hypothetical protein
MDGHVEANVFCDQQFIEVPRWGRALRRMGMTAGFLVAI